MKTKSIYYIIDGENGRWNTLGEVRNHLLLMNETDRAMVASLLVMKFKGDEQISCRKISFARNKVILKKA